MEKTGLLRSSARDRESGFTLVEALVAIVVLAFGLIAVTNLMMVAGTSNMVANSMTASTTAATRTLEDLKARPFDDPALAIGGSVDDDSACPAYCRDDSVPGVATIHTRWQVVGTGDGELVFIRVRSEAQGAMARQRSRAEFTTFRACTNRDINCPPP